MFDPEEKTKVFHEAKYKVFLQMGNHQREYRYHQYMKLSREYFNILLITELIKWWYFQSCPFQRFDEQDLEDANMTSAKVIPRSMSNYSPNPQLI